MQNEFWKWRPSFRTAGVLAAALSLLLAAPAIAKDASDPASGRAFPDGWSAGSVHSGSGYVLPDGSQRVREVQRKLSRLGYEPGVADGLFGPRTADAVRRYQAGSGLQADGIVGARTLASLRARAAKSGKQIAFGSGYALPNGSQRVRAVQRKLTELGYRPGVADGLFGPQTDRAVRRYQTKGGIAVDGIVGAGTLRRLVGRDRARFADLSAPAPGAQFREVDSGLDWWELLLIGAAGLLTGLAVLGAAWAFVVANRRRRLGRQYGAQRSLRALDEPVQVEGLSHKESVGEFRGVAYAVHGTGDETEVGAVDPLFLVRDPAKRTSIAVRLSEITKIGPVKAPAAPVGGPGPHPETAPGESPLRGRRRGAAPGRGRFARRRPLEGTSAIRRRPETSSAKDPMPPIPLSSLERRPPVGGGAGEDAQDPDRIRLIGARVDLAGDPSPESGGLPVHLRLFAESERNHWETAVLDPDGPPASIDTEDVETAIRDLVVPGRLPQLAATLREAGVGLEGGALERLPFVVEPTRRFERELAKRRFSLSQPS